MEIWQAAPSDLNTLTGLAAQLWPGHAADALAADLAEQMQNGQAFFLLRAGWLAAGFAQCSLRHDYVEGTSVSPAGYLEGIFVHPAFRGRGFARALLAACEDWARAQGCREFASDCGLDNTASQHFHRAAGFTETARIVCFIKPL